MSKQLTLGPVTKEIEVYPNVFIDVSNRVENLEWATQREQKLHSISHGLCEKNIEALSRCNKMRSRKVYLEGALYDSIRAAARITGHDREYIKKHGDFFGGGCR